MTIIWRGCEFNAAYLANHYRKMADREPMLAWFWRDLARQVIDLARMPVEAERLAA